ncbi:MAG: type VI secretion system baseplate subunit TssG [Salinisphaera sp.]|nr:type VI secretion system baseplate subunit TssG [Salinisphaera sp.]
MSVSQATLDQSPQRFTLFAALRLIEAGNAARPRLGQSRRPAQDAVRVGQQPQLWFAPSDVTAYQAGSPARLTCASFGLFGPNGALPLHLTEYARQRERDHRDPTFTAFADMFHHRMTTLFYRAWADAQPTTHRDRPQADRFATYLGALAGLGTPGLRGRVAVSDLAVFHRAGRFGPTAKSAEGLEDILSDYFGMPITVESHVPRWLEMPRRERLLLDRARRKRLGRDANLGSRSWQCQFGFRLLLGPLDHRGFEDFLPGGSALTALAALVRHYVGDELAWQLELGVEPGATDVTRLGQAGRLAWNAWLGRGEGRRSRRVRRVRIDGTRWGRPARLARVLQQRAKQRVEA